MITQACQEGKHEKAYEAEGHCPGHHGDTPCQCRCHYSEVDYRALAIQGAIQTPPPVSPPANHPFEKLESCTLNKDNKIITLILARGSGPNTTLELTIDAACSVSADLHRAIQLAVHLESGSRAIPRGV